jgi:PHD/YefM family antitoxin component YafN of YafNO toxin-antitoxin module
MEAVKVGIREFREKLATYILAGDKPIAITRHGDTVGYFLPTRPKRSEADLRAFQEAAEKIDRQLAAAGVTEEEINEDIELALKGLFP